eukprot:scaffold10626_cov112-Cylindrotheca_fusiformis.AAC.12
MEHLRQNSFEQEARPDCRHSPSTIYQEFLQAKLCKQKEKGYKGQYSVPVLFLPLKGYVAGPLVKSLLEAGLTVHCAVRDPEKEEKVKHLVDAAEGTKGTVKFFKGDLLDEGSYEEAMKGCSVVFHTASPFFMNADPSKVDEQLLEPAVTGTRNVLNSVAKTPSVKRVVVTSSIAATCSDPTDRLNEPGQVITEECWNKTASREYNPYAYSKTLAEKEAWKMADAQSQYKLVVVNPGLVLGPGLKVHPTSTSYGIMKQVGKGDYADGAPGNGKAIVDVRSVAKIHVAAGFSDKAEGRYLAIGHNTSWYEMFAEIMAPKLPDYPLPKRKIPSESGEYVEFKTKNDKSIRDFGIEYIPLETTLLDMFHQCADGGLFPKKP